MSSRTSWDTEAVCDAAYRAVLGRPADPSGLAAYASALGSPDDLRRLLATLIESSEYRRLIARTHAWPPALGPAALAADALERSFRSRLQRAPSSAELVEFFEHVSRGERTGQVVGRMVSRRSERLTRSPRILLFGAYGNGNMGDAYQAVALRTLLANHWQVDERAIDACSLLDSADYPYPADQKLPSGAINDVDIVNGYDCLVIGGGGLLAHPHEPLADGEWVQRLNLPIVVLAVGATTGRVDEHRALLEAAWSVSGRDSEALDALRTLRPDAFLLRDPILCAGDLSRLRRFDPRVPSSWGARTAPARRILWVLKHASGPRDEAILDWVGAYIGASSERHDIVAIEPALDVALEARFPGRVTYTRTLAELEPHLASCELVVSMRYHGAIFGALSGRKSVGSSQGKLRYLYSEAGLAGRFEHEPAGLAAALHEAMHCAADAHPTQALSRLHGEFAAGLQRVRSTLQPWCWKPEEALA